MVLDPASYLPPGLDGKIPCERLEENRPSYQESTGEAGHPEKNDLLG